MRPPHAELSRKPRTRTLALTATALLSFALIAGLWSSSGSGSQTKAAAKPSWLVVSSTRDGSSEASLGGGLRAYSMRPDGSRFTRLLEKRRELDPIDVSADGSTIAYGTVEYDPQTIYVSRADGTGLRRVAHFDPDQSFVESAVLSPDGAELALTTGDANDNPRLYVVDADGGHRRDLGRAADPAWSPDGKKLALATGRGCAVVREPFEGERPARVRGRCRVPKWSPDGKSFVFETKGGCAVVRSPGSSEWLSRLEQALQGGPVLLRGKCSAPAWSPDGRWIAFETHRGLWVIRPNGEDRRRVGPAHDVTETRYSWSPDSRRLAIGDLVMTLTGRTKRLGIRGSSESTAAPIWSRDGKRLALVGQTGEEPAQIWIVRADGSGPRRLTSAGVNDVVGLAGLAPARPPAGPPPWSERVLGPSTLETRRPIGLISADGARVAYTAGTTATDCEHVSIWTPATRSVLRVWQRLPAPCGEDRLGDSLFELALSRSFIGWSVVFLCGNSGCGSELRTAALPKAEPKVSADDDGTDYGNESHAYFSPIGHGNIFASWWTGIRVALPGGKVRRCKPFQGNGYTSVDGHWIAGYEGDSNIAVVDDRCALVKVLRFGNDEVKAALLDGDGLVVELSGQLESYDVRSGALELQRPLPAGYFLSDVSGGIALLRHGRTILLLRLSDGRSLTLEPGRGPVSAEIEAPGLYYAYTTATGRGRLELVPRAVLERRLDANAG